MQAFNRASGIESLVIALLVLDPQPGLGRPLHGIDIGVRTWRRALVEAMARQATLALHQSRVCRTEPRRGAAQAVLEERNRWRDIHDTLAQDSARS